MPTLPYTDWQLEANDVGVLAWAEGRDDRVEIDFAPKLAEGEPLSAQAADLWQLPNATEGDAALLASADGSGTDAAALLPTATEAEGTIVRQRVAGLARGRVYRLRFWIGPAGNRRDQGVVIEVARA